MGFKEDLSTFTHAKIHIGELMKKHTAFGVGGSADYYLEPESLYALCEALSLCKLYKVPYKVIGNGLTVIKQVPKAGDALAHGGTVVLYTDDTTSGKTVVPDVVGLTSSAANKAITDAGLNITIVGTSPDHLDGAIAVSQSIEENTAVDKGTIITVDFRNYSNITD